MGFYIIIKILYNYLTFARVFPAIPKFIDSLFMAVKIMASNIIWALAHRAF